MTKLRRLLARVLVAVCVLVMHHGSCGQPWPPYAQILADNVAVKCRKFRRLSLEKLPELGVAHEVFTHFAIETQTAVPFIGNGTHHVHPFRVEVVRCLLSTPDGTWRKRVRCQIDYLIIKIHPLVMLGLDVHGKVVV